MCLLHSRITYKVFHKLSMCLAGLFLLCCPHAMHTLPAFPHPHASALAFCLARVVPLFALKGPLRCPSAFLYQNIFMLPANPAQI